MAVYFSQLQPGDTILAMDLSHGGHLHARQSGQLLRPVLQGRGVRRPRVRSAARLRAARGAGAPAPAEDDRRRYSAYPREIDFQAFRTIADEVGALLMTDMAHFAGLVRRRHPSVTGAVFGLRHQHDHKTLRGPRGGLILFPERHAKTVNSSIFPGNQGGPLMH